MRKKVPVTKCVEIENDIKVHPALKVFFGYSLYKAGLIFRTLMERKHLNIYDLAAPECGILFILSKGEVANQLSVGQDMGIDKATMVKMIDKLESLKLVKRDVDPTDRRSKLISLTPKGNTTLEKIRTLRNATEDEVFTAFSKEDEAHLRRLVPQLLEVMMNIKN